MNIIKAWLLAILCLAAGIAVVALIPYLMAIGIGLIVFILVKLATTDVDINEPP